MVEFIKLSDLCDLTNQIQKGYYKNVVLKPTKIHVVDSEQYINIAGQEKKVTFVRPRDAKQHMATVDQPVVCPKTWDSSGTYKEDVDKYIVEEEMDVDDNSAFNSPLEGYQATVTFENKDAAGHYMQTNGGGGRQGWHNKVKKKSSSTNNVNRVKRSSSTKDVNRVKRPLNPFMMWSTVERRRINCLYPRMHNMEVSKMLGATWKQMTYKQRAPYIQESARLRDLHLKLYPDYKYKPRHNTNAFHEKLP